MGLALTSKAVRFMERKPYPPGQHGEKKQRVRKISDFKRQLLEKQRLRYQYNIREGQMRIYVKKAIQQSGNPEDHLFQMLETRLDAFVYRAGLARTMSAARQYVTHRHILVNGKWVNIPSYRIKVNDIVSVKDKSRNLRCFIEATEEMINLPPPYLERSKQHMSAKLVSLPRREEVPVSCQAPLVIEYYSR